MQAAQAHDGDRASFREFRQQNGGVDRQALRNMFRQEFGRGNAAPKNEVQTPALVPHVDSSLNAINQIQNQRVDRLQRRLDRHDGVINQSVQAGDNGLVNLRNGVNLDLSSAARNITLGQNLFKNVSSVEINVGGQTKTVSAGAEVSAAEYIAVKQILAGSSQKITIDGLGIATGGEVDLSAITANNDVMRASDLVVPVNVTTYGDFSKRSDFKLLGDLTNSGTVHTYGNGRRGGSLAADDIVNQAGALISSDTALALLASGNLSNFGTITSKGSVTLSAGNTLTNSGDVSAKENVNLSAATVVNSGAIQSLKGDINIDGAAVGDLNVNGAGGSFTADAINIRNAAYTGAANTNVTGGDFFSNTLNLNSGAGVLRANVGELTGTVNQTGSEIHVEAATADLVLGDVCLTGDPTYKNSAGNIHISGNITVAEDLAIIASGNITSANNISIIANDGVDGCNITLIAGADQVPGGTNSATLPPGTPSGTTLTGLASTSGGSVLLGTNVVVDATGANNVADDAGDIFIAAFAGLGFNSGRVNVGGAQLNASSLFGTVGNIDIIAGAQNTTAVIVGEVGAFSVLSGNINITTAQPVSSDTLPIDFNANGQIISGNQLVASGTLSTGANVQLNNGEIAAGNSVNISSGGTINQLAGASILGGTVNLLADGNITNSGTSNITAAGTLNVESLNGNIGTSAGSRLRTDAISLNAQANTGSVFVNNTDDVELLGGSALNTYDVQADGIVTTNGSVSASVVNLRSTNNEIDLSDNITATTSITLRSQTDLGTSANLIAPTVNLRSEAGNIAVNTNANSIVVTALAGDATIFETNNVNFAGGSSYVAGALYVSANGTIGSTSNVVAGSILLDANGFNLASTLTAVDLVDLHSTASITNASIGSAVFVAPELRLFSLNGSIGTSAANPLNLDANLVTLNAPLGSVWVSDPNSVTVGGASMSGALNDFSVVANLNLLSSNGIVGNAVSLTATNGSLQLNGSVDSDLINLTSRNSITNASVAGGFITGPLAQINLTSTAGNIGQSSDYLSLPATSATVNAPLGSAYVTSASAIILNGANNVGIDLYVLAGQTGQQGGTIVAGRDFSMIGTGPSVVNIENATAGRNATIGSALNVAIIGPLTATTGDVKITSLGTSTLSSGDITAGRDIVIDVTSGISTDTYQSTLNAGRDILIETLSDVSITSVAEFIAGRDISLVSTETVSVAGPITATGDVSLTANGAFNQTAGTIEGANVFIASASDSVNALDVQATNEIIVIASNSLVDSSFGNNPTALQAPFITLISTNGDIGTSVDLFDIDATNLILRANAVYAFDLNSVNLYGSSGYGSASFGGNFELGATGAITTTGTIYATAGNLFLAASTIALGNDAYADVDAFMSASGGVLTTSADATVTVLGTATLTSATASGVIGTSPSSRFNVSAGSLDLSATDAYIYSPGNVTFNLGSAVSNLLDVVAEDNITVGPVSLTVPQTIVFEATTGIIQFNGTMFAPNVSLTTGQSMLDSHNLQNVNASNLSLTSTGGDIGTFVTPITLNFTVDNLTANAPTGSVYIDAPGPITISGVSGALNDFYISAVGNLSVNAAVSANFVSFAATSGGLVTSTATITGNSVQILSNAGIANGNLATIVSETLYLTATAGDIGTSSDFFDVDTDFLYVSAPAGSAFVSDSDDLTLVNGNAATDLRVEAAADLAVIGFVNAPGIVLATGGQFDISGTVDGTTIQLISEESILNANITGTLQTGAGNAVTSLSIASVNGDIGASGDALDFDATGVQLSANNVYASDLASGVTVEAFSSATGDFELSAVGGSVASTAAGDISAQDVVISAPAGGIVLDGQVQGTSSITLTSANSISNTSVLGGLVSPLINLTSTAGAISITTVDFTNVTANAAQQVVLTDTTGSMNIGPGASSAGTSFTATAPLNITNDGTIDAVTVSLTATTGGFTFNNVITGTTSITLTSSDDILNGVGLGQLVTPTLSATSTNGDIGQLLDPLNINVANLTANTPLGSVYVHNLSALNINGVSGAQNIFSVTADGTITVQANVNAANVFLTASAGSGGWVESEGAAVFITGTNTITISSDDEILEGDFDTLLVTPNLTLRTTSGSIGASGTPFLVATNVLTIESAAGAFVSDNNSVDVAAASALTTLNVAAATNLTSSGTITAADVVLQATGGALTLSGLVRGTNSISLTSSASILNANIAGGLDSGIGVPVNQLNLTSTAGNLGTSAASDLNISANNVTLNAPAGSVYVADPDDLHFGPGNSGALVDFVIDTTGTISSTGTITAANVILFAPDGFDLDGLVTGTGATGNITLSAVNGDITNSSISGGLVSVNLELIANSVGTLLSPLAIDATNLFSDTTGSTFIQDSNSINIEGGFVDVGTYQVSVVNNINVDNLVATTISAPIVTLNATGNITLEASVSGATSVDLLAGNLLTQTGGTVSGGDLTIDFNAGTTTLATNVASLLTLGGTTLTINEASGLILHGQSTTSLTINAALSTAGAVTTTTDFAIGVLDIENNNGNIVISNNLGAFTSMLLDTFGGTGSIQQTAGVLTTPSLTVTAGSGGIGGGGNELVVTNGIGAVALNANATGGGDVAIDYSGTGILTLAASAGNDNYTIRATNGGNIVTGGNISGTGALVLETDNLTHANTFSFDTISISNPGAGGLTVNGGAGGVFTTVNGAELTATLGDLTLNGTMTFNGTGDATFTLGDQDAFFVVSAGADVVGVNAVIINACDLVLTGNLEGNPIIINCDHNGTIANSTGDVVLTSDLIFLGQNLAILAAGNITSTGGSLIDLSGTGNSGSLTLMAGYDFTPATGGQVQNGLTYTITGVSATGGSVDLGAFEVVLNGGTGSGGNLLAVANAGTPNAGSIDLGNVSTTGNTTGGSVTLIGPGGINIGDIDTNGLTASGNVSFSVAAPTIVGGPITVQNGVLVTGSFGVGAQTAGNLTFNDIDAGTANVTIRGGLGATDTVTQASGDLAANQLNLFTGVGIVSIAQSAISELNSTGSGAITFNAQVGNLLLNNVTGAGQNLSITSVGTISTGATAVAVDILTLVATAGNDIVLGGNVNGTSEVNLIAAGTITQNAGTIGGGALFLDFGTGPVTLSTNVTSMESFGGDTLTINEANDLQLNTQSVSDLFVNVTNGNVTTGNDWNVDNLSINVTNGTVAISNAVGATTSTTVFADDGMTSSGAGVLAGGTTTLTSNGNIGTDALNKFQIDATTFAVDGANVFVHNQNTGAATLNASTADAALDVSTAGDLATGGNISAVTLALSTGGAFSVNNTLTGTTSVSLTADGNLTNVGGTLTTPTLLLNSVNGNVGTDVNNPFVVAANVTQIGGSALGTGGGFFVRSSSTAGVNFVQVDTDGDILLAADGGLTIADDITSDNGAIRIEATRDLLDIADGVTILGNDQIDIVQLGTFKKRDLMNFGQGSQVLTDAKLGGLGDINIILGPAQSPGNKIPTPKKNVTIVETGGLVQFGGKKAKAAGPGNVFTGQGANVFVSTFNAKAITFEGGVIITADPPVAPGTPTVIRGGMTSNAASAIPLNLSSTTLSVSQPAHVASVAGDSISNLQLNGLNPAELQMINATNAVVTGSTSFGKLATNELTLAVGSTEDDSVMRTNAPQGTMAIDASLCSDMELSGDAHIGNVQRLAHSNLVTLDKGSVLFAPQSDTTVVTPNGTVKIAADSLAMVVVDGNHLSVYDINDTHKKSVVIEAGGRTIPLSPGKHAVVTHSKVAQFSDVNPVETVMHRGLAQHELGEGRRAFTSEFSVPSAIQSIKPLAAMIQSNHTQAKKVRDRVLKTSAIIMQLTPGAAPYEFHAKSRTVALKW